MVSSCKTTDTLRDIIVICVGERHVARGPSGRFVIYLPKDKNNIWEKIHKSGYKVEVYIALKQQ